MSAGAKRAAVLSPLCSECRKDSNFPWRSAHAKSFDLAHSRGCSTAGHTDRMFRACASGGAWCGGGAQESRGFWLTQRRRDLLQHSFALTAPTAAASVLTSSFPPVLLFVQGSAFVRRGRGRGDVVGRAPSIGGEFGGLVRAPLHPLARPRSSVHFSRRWDTTTRRVGDRTSG